MSSYPVRLVAPSGREQDVVLRVRRDGLWLFTEQGKEIQQLPYQHIIKWLPSKLRSRDPGSDDCLDIQVETASGKKDLRMRCQSVAAVGTIISDIRATVQAIMADLDPQKARQSSPLRAGLAATAAAAAAAKGGTATSGSPRALSRTGSEAVAAAGGSPTPSPQQQQQQPQPAAPSPPERQQQQAVQQQQQQWQQHPPLQEQQQQLQQRPPHQQHEHEEQQQQQGFYSQQQPTPVLRSSLYWSNPEAAAGAQQSAAHAGNQVAQQQLPQQPGGTAAVTAPRSAGALPDQEAAAQIQFLEELVRRLSEELAARLAAELQTAAGGAAGAPSSGGGSAAFGHEPSDDLPLPPWMADSRYLNPLLSAYDQRLAAGQSELAAKAAAVRAIQQQVAQLVAENDGLHDRLEAVAARLDGRPAEAAAAAAMPADAADQARLQERLELLEQENDLLVSQQAELDAELAKLATQLEERQREVQAAQEAAAATAVLSAELQAALRDSSRAASSSRGLKARVKELSERLQDESARAAAAAGAAEASEQRCAALRGELAAAQAAVGAMPKLQVELSKAQTEAQAASADAGAARSECEGLRVALRAVEGRLLEYQQKDTEVYLRIKQAMELAEEARLERDAARTTTGSLAAQLAATQSKLAEATRQLLGGSVDGQGGPGWPELRRRLTASEGELASAQQQLEQQHSQLVELRLSVQRLERDKASLTSELGSLRQELCLCSGGVHSPLPAARGGGGLAGGGGPGGVLGLTERLADAERARDDALLALDSHKRAAQRAEREWQLERQKLQASVQQLSRRVEAAEAAATAAAVKAGEAQAAAAAAEAEQDRLRAAAGRSEAALQQQLAELRQQGDAQAQALSAKLERALAACNTSVADAERMLAAKDQLLGRWKQEAQLIAAKLEVALQQHQAELAERQEQADSLAQQLAAALQQQEALQQELDERRVACQEGDAWLADADARAAVAASAAATAQEDLLKELRHLQGQLERCHLEKLRAERARDGLTAKLERLLGSTTTGSLRSSYDYASPRAAAIAAGAVPSGAGRVHVAAAGSPLVKAAAAVLGAREAAADSEQEGEELGQEKDQRRQQQQQLEVADGAAGSPQQEPLPEHAADEREQQH